MTPSQVAARYKGAQEIKGNKFIDDPKVEKDLGEILKKAGHKDGEAWCCYFAEACFCEAYPEKANKLRGLFSPSAVQTLKNFKAAGYTILQDPVKDALVIWQRYENGVPSWQGHAGIVDTVYTGMSWRSWEGNTNTAGERETNEGVVALQPRKKAQVMTGLRVIGFVLI